jgi:hypothetical protein
MSRKIMALPPAMAAACSNDSGLGGGDATDDGGPSRNDASHDGGGEDRHDTGTTVVHQVTRFDLHGAGRLPGPPLQFGSASLPRLHGRDARRRGGERLCGCNDLKICKKVYASYPQTYSSLSTEAHQLFLSGACGVQNERCSSFTSFLYL